MWEKGFVRKAMKSQTKDSQENLAIDRDIIEFFKAQEQNYKRKSTICFALIWKRISQNKSLNMYEFTILKKSMLVAHISCPAWFFCFSNDFYLKAQFQQFS